MPNWKRLSKETVYETNWIRVIKSDTIDHNGKKVTYSYVELPYPAVLIVALNEKGEIYLHKQYRYPIDEAVWEVPAGGSDGEDFLVAAKRELKEESGLVSDDWSQIAEFNAFDGSGNCHFILFIARDARKVTEDDGIEDIIESKFFSVDEIMDMIRSNTIVCAETLSSLALALPHLKK